MSKHSFPSSYNPYNSNLPLEQPYFPKGQSFGTRQGRAPTSPPPSSIPRHGEGLVNMESGLFKGCLNRNTYIELVNHSSFWFHPTYVDYFTTQGFMWNGYTWITWETDLSKIVSFQCT